LEAVYVSSQHSINSAVFGRHTSWFVVSSSKSFFISLKIGLFLYFLFYFVLVLLLEEFKGRDGKGEKWLCTFNWRRCKGLSQLGAG
jgi:hypothetical protein